MVPLKMKFSLLSKAIHPRFNYPPLFRQPTPASFLHIVAPVVSFAVLLTLRTVVSHRSGRGARRLVLLGLG